MNQTFTYKPTFDLSYIKNPEMKKSALSAFYLMELTLTPQLFMHYLRAISCTDYKVAMKILRAINRHCQLDPESRELPAIGLDQGQLLLENIIYDMQHCARAYNGGFLYGIMVDMEITEHTPEYEILKRFMVELFNRLYVYVCND